MVMVRTLDAWDRFDPIAGITGRKIKSNLPLKP
jgi:hypothetical protein